MIDENGSKSFYTYDSRGNKTSTKDANGNTTSYTYDQDSNMSRITDSMGNTTTIVEEMNGYVKFMSGKKYGFVGLDRATGDITTFHVKTVSELMKKAPSLGFGK